MRPCVEKHGSSELWCVRYNPVIGGSEPTDKGEVSRRRFTQTTLSRSQSVDCVFPSLLIGTNTYHHLLNICFLTEDNKQPAGVHPAPDTVLIPSAGHRAARRCDNTHKPTNKQTFSPHASSSLCRHFISENTKDSTRRYYHHPAVGESSMTWCISNWKEKESIRTNQSLSVGQPRTRHTVANCCSLLLTATVDTPLSCQHGRGCFSWVKFTVFSLQGDKVMLLWYWDIMIRLVSRYVLLLKKKTTFLHLQFLARVAPLQCWPTSPVR